MPSDRRCQSRGSNLGWIRRRSAQRHVCVQMAKIFRTLSTAISLLGSTFYLVLVSRCDCLLAIKVDQNVLLSYVHAYANNNNYYISCQSSSTIAHDQGR